MYNIQPQIIKMQLTYEELKMIREFRRTIPEKTYKKLDMDLK